jgi:hypothetical protein
MCSEKKCSEKKCNEKGCRKKYCCCDVIIFKCYLTDDFNDDLYRYIKISTSYKNDINVIGENTSILYIKPNTQKGYIGNLYIPVENIQNNTIYYTFNLYEDKSTIVIKDQPVYNYVNDRPIKLNNKCEYKLHINNQPTT